MKFHVTGVDHFSAPLELRSKFNFTDSQKAEFSAGLLRFGIDEAVILSTCNRSEVYYISDEAADIEAELKSFFSVRDDAGCLFTYSGRDALYHLFKVAAGLESAVIGEDQILGQVKTALETSQALGTSGKVMNKIFREAVTTAKLIKTDLKLSQIPLSVSYIAIQLLSRALGSIEGKRVMVAGTGEMSRIALEYLISENAEEIILCGRTESKSLALAEKSGKIKACSFGRRFELLSGVDAVITATSSPHPIFSRSQLPPLTRPVFFVDMAVPPDVSSDVYDMENAAVVNIDDLKTVADTNYERRSALSIKAEEIIGQSVAELEQWIAQSRMDTAIESMTRRCGAISDETLSFIFSKLDLTEREKKLISKMMNSALRRVVREPILRLKSLKSAKTQEEYCRAIKELFDEQ